MRLSGNLRAPSFPSSPTPQLSAKVELNLTPHLTLCWSSCHHLIFICFANLTRNSLAGDPEGEQLNLDLHSSRQDEHKRVHRFSWMTPGCSPKLDRRFLLVQQSMGSGVEAEIQSARDRTNLPKWIGVCCSHSKTSYIKNPWIIQHTPQLRISIVSLSQDRTVVLVLLLWPVAVCTRKGSEPFGRRLGYCGSKWQLLAKMLSTAAFSSPAFYSKHSRHCWPCATSNHFESQI